ncbi:GNAT family N-acetyltransferase [Halobacillus sp. KGW1]|uniref:GNAT family N-acetyltransferase n=1 Tax=Halobacillus sp. KGW1 TaxID=1793726 RepID=UPI0007840C7E|nr:GNAT family N-acetyltransferase [Halobacillus sp. KGW1]
MQVRELNGKDAADYYELRLEALLTNPDAFLTTYVQEKQRPDPIPTTADRLDNDLSRTFGLFSDGKLSGVVTLVKETHPKYLHKANIVAMYVTPSIRGSGGGEMLMNEVMQFAKAIRIELLHLSVVTENKAAKRLYAKVGFKTYGTEKHAVKLEKRYLDEEHMECFLT